MKTAIRIIPGVGVSVDCIPETPEEKELVSRLSGNEHSVVLRAGINSLLLFFDRVKR